MKLLRQEYEKENARLIVIRGQARHNDSFCDIKLAENDPLID